jgi:uncharacterized membrane protein SpoIIM required for sporulation
MPSPTVRLALLWPNVIGNPSPNSPPIPPRMINVQRWVARREPDWKQLEALLRQTETQGLQSLKPEQVRSLASLYRSVSTDLARAQTHQVGEVLIHDLQHLTRRAYNQVYQSAQPQEWRKVWEFCRWGFPAIVQTTFLYTLIATLLFVLSGLIAWWFAWQDPTFIEMLVPDEMIRPVRDEGKLWMGSIVGSEPTASSNIMTNNISVCVRAIAGGLPLGLGTFYILVFNGLLIGTIAALVAQNNLSIPFWAFVFPHGALELPAIFLSGGAGLLIAKALLLPGSYRRVDAFKLYGPQVAQLVYGIVPMLVLAGAIEGFISPNPNLPNGLKYLLGTLIFLGLLLYCRQRRA